MKKIKSISILILGVVFLAVMCQPVIADSDKININTDSKEQLMTLYRVGEKIAQRIIDYRQKNPFKTIEELMNVKGIGQSVFDKNKDLITVKDE